MKKLLLIIALPMAILSCKKEDMSKYATTDQLASYAKNDALTNLATNEDVSGVKAKGYVFSLTFGPALQTYQFAPTVPKSSPQDVVLTFVMNEMLGTDTAWTQCPITLSSFMITPEFVNYSLIINVDKTDGTSGSPFTSNQTFLFKAVVIPSSGIAAKPNVDLTNYKEVKKAFLD